MQEQRTKTLDAAEKHPALGTVQPFSDVEFFSKMDLF
jgi:hypothetical protein